MTDSVARWARVQEIFHTALERTGAERDRFLREACGNDRVLRAEVDSLLLADEEAGAFAERPALEALGPLEMTGSAGRQPQPGDRSSAPVPPRILASHLALTPGTRLGVYEVIASIGVGGMGEVYRATDTTLGRQVAIKILPDAFASDPECLARFEREARTLASLNHPHIAAIYAVEKSAGAHALVMELVEGDDLSQRIARGAVPVDEALPIAKQIAEALEAAHEQGIIHRDLKPANIKVRSDGTVKVLDFGLAKAMDPVAGSAPKMSPAMTQPGVILGTAAYMSPEQARGRTVDKRADIWAFGVVLFEMLTGTRAFEGKGISETLARVIEREPAWNRLPATLSPALRTCLDRCLQKDPRQRIRDIGDVRLALDGAFETAAPSTPSSAASPTSVVKKCLSKGPDERWQSASDLAAALRWSADDISADYAITGPTVSRGRRRAVTLVAVTVAAALMAAAVWAVGSGRRGAAASALTPRFIPVTFRAGTLTAARFTPDGDSIVYSAAWGDDPYGLFMTRRDSVESRRLDIPDAKLLGVSSSGELAFLRGPHSALRLLNAGGGTLLHVSITGGGPRELLDDVIAADWKPGGSDLAVVRRGQVEFPLGTKIYGQHRFRHVRIAPDGRRLALVEGTGRDAEGRPVAAAIALLDRSGRKTTLSSGWGDLTSLAWSPSGDEVWFTANRREDLTTSALRAVSTDGRERLILPYASAFLAIHDVFSDSRVLLSSNVSRTGCSCLAPGETQPRDLGWLDGPAPEALSADGRTVLMAEMLRAGGAEHSIYLRKTDGSDAVRLGDGFPEDLSSDGKWVLAVPARTRQHWLILPTGSGSPRTLPPGPLVQRFEANFLSDGRRIVFGGQEANQGRRIYVQDVQSGSVRPISPENVGTVALATPDGRFVIGSTGAKRFLYPVDGGAPVPFPFMASDETAVQWSSDGRLLYVRREATWPPVVDRVDVSTGRREAWKTIQPADPVGVDSISRILVTPDGKAYCHDYVRFLSELFIVEGVK